MTRKQVWLQRHLGGDQTDVVGEGSAAGEPANLGQQLIQNFASWSFKVRLQNAS
jgi:hypothetical protein